MFQHSGNKDEYARGCQRWRNQFEMAEEHFDLCFRGAVEVSPFNDFLQHFSHDSGKQSGPHQLDQKRLERSAAGKIRLLPGLPEINNYREHGPGMEHDQKQGHLRRRWVDAHQFFGNDHVSRAGYGEKFGESLHNRQENHLENRHKASVPAEFCRISPDN